MAALNNIFIAIAIFSAIALGFALATLRHRTRIAAIGHRMLRHDANILEAFPMAFAYFDADDRFIQINDKLHKLLPNVPDPGARTINRLGFFRALTEAGTFVEAADREPAFLGELTALAEQRQVEWEVTLTDGRSLQISERATMDGGRLIACRDITTQKQQSRALNEKSELLRQSLESLDQGVLVLGPDSALLTWNQRYFELFGTTSKIAKVGQPLEELIKIIADAGLMPGVSVNGAKRRAQAMMSCVRHSLN